MPRTKRNKSDAALDNNPGKRRNDEIKPPPGVPDMPSWLGERAADEWRRVVPILDSMGVLSVLDRAAIADYCRCVERVESMESELDAAGFTKAGANRSVPGLDGNGKNQGGGDVRNPLFIVAKQYRQSLQKWCEILGIAPGRRERAPVEVDSDPDGLLD